ncbi:MAG TPA: PilZ domain-containing protein [Nitrospira sp.]|nr:PilZ domain-containing protein [Nitrospira sp.]
MKPKPPSPSHLKMPDALDRRDAERAPLSYRVTYSLEGTPHVDGVEGIMREVSKTGSKISSASPPPVGSRLNLCVDVEDGKPPMVFAGALVCWVTGDLFGVKFLPMEGEQRQRLQQIILRKVTRSGSADQRAAFRILKQP